MLLYVIRSYYHSNKPAAITPKHPEVLVFKNYTQKELVRFDGTGPDGRVLMAVNGSVYDVTRGRNFYGPGKAKRWFDMYLASNLTDCHQVALTLTLLAVMHRVV